MTKGGDFGVFAGLSYTFGGNMSAASSTSITPSGATASASVAKFSGGGPGSAGWRVAKGEGGNSYTSADGSYQGTKGLLQAGAYQEGDKTSLYMSLDGAMVAAGGGVFFGNRIDDAFAVVDAGAPNVPVRVENRPEGTTGSDGKLLVTGLKAYQNNKISIDVSGLPVMADIPRTETYVAPREGSGVKVDFGIKPSQAAAIVIITDGEGKVLPAGSAVTLAGHADAFIVGFDGDVYMTGLAGDNHFDSTVNSVACSGQFKFTAGSDVQQVIGPVKCA